MHGIASCIRQFRPIPQGETSCAALSCFMTATFTGGVLRLYVFPSNKLLPSRAAGLSG